MVADCTDSRNGLTQPLLRATNVRKSYVGRQWLSSRKQFAALAGVNLELPEGSSSALVGRSGGGKSTLVRCLARMEEPDSGDIWFEGVNLLSLRGSELKQVRRRIQLVFQHSAVAINPAFSALEAVEEPLRIIGVPKKDRRLRALAAIERMGLPGAWANRSPLEFSGGERQRLALARALIVEPKLLILDEPLAGLDALTRQQIVNLLLDLRAAVAITYLFVLHDLKMASYLADTISVVEEGRIVETGKSADVCNRPEHFVTQQLVAAIPRLPAQDSEFEVGS
jgi:ABC-type glutathione transport system ATPase component